MTTIWAAIPEALPRFYGSSAGKLPQTSQINVAGYMEFFESLLQKGGRAAHRIYVRAVRLGDTTPFWRRRS